MRLGVRALHGGRAYGGQRPDEVALGQPDLCHQPGDQQRQLRGGLYAALCVGGERTQLPDYVRCRVIFAAGDGDPAAQQQQQVGAPFRRWIQAQGFRYDFQRLVPASRRCQRRGQIESDRRRRKAREAKLPGPGQALPAGLDRALVVAAAFEHMGNSGASAHLKLDRADAPGGLARPKQRRDDVVALPGPDLGERHQRFSLVLLVAEPLGQAGQLFGAPFRFLVATPEPQGPAELGQDLGAHPVRAAGQS